MASHLALSLPMSRFNLTKVSATITTATPSTSQTYDQKFGRKGIKFTESSNISSVELTVRNGSSLCLQIPDVLVISYKTKVYWKDDGCQEILYTVPGGSDSTKGGIGLVLNDLSDAGSKVSPLRTSEWVVEDVVSDSIDALQVELSCTCGSLDLSYIVTLYPQSMATAVIVKNNGLKVVNLTSAILTHMKLKSRRGSAIQGLRGCSYCTHPPLPSSFGIMSPADAMQAEPAGWFSFGSEPENKVGSWTIEDQLYTLTKNKLSRVYSAPPAERLKRIYNTPPSKYEIIDQGHELFFRLIRMEYDDIYLSSPGSSSQEYGKDYFICAGPASMMVPVFVNPGEEWRGAQVIEHDNL